MRAVSFHLNSKVLPSVPHSHSHQVTEDILVSRENIWVCCRLRRLCHPYSHQLFTFLPIIVIYFRTISLPQQPPSSEWEAPTSDDHPILLACVTKICTSSFLILVFSDLMQHKSVLLPKVFLSFGIIHADLRERVNSISNRCNKYYSILI